MHIQVQWDKQGTTAYLHFCCSAGQTGGDLHLWCWRAGTHQQQIHFQPHPSALWEKEWEDLNHSSNPPPGVALPLQCRASVACEWTSCWCASPQILQHWNAFNLHFPSGHTTQSGDISLMLLKTPRNSAIQVLISVDFAQNCFPHICRIQQIMVCPSYHLLIYST